MMKDPLCEDHIRELENSFSDHVEIIFGPILPSPINTIIKYAPQIVIIDLDFIEAYETFLIDIKNLPFNSPKIIGISSDFRRAYLALKNGFFDIIIKPDIQTKLLQIVKQCENSFFNKDQCITISTPKEIRYLSTSEILMFKADNNYVNVFLNDGETFSIFNTLSHFQKNLGLPFLRVHKSHIINIHFVSRINYAKKFLKLKGCEKFIPFTEKYTLNIRLIDTLKKEVRMNINPKN
ncbi:LytR/AlgR family response regulator transcription factor [Aequorivita sublithincola]|nr:LytTR family transcriptional regulator DNA-binding domain-containing protein [Aequorivita sublithincola]